MKRTSDGFTLIEVLIAVLILSVGLLGIAGTLLSAMRSSTSNYLKQQAVQHAYDIVDRMHSNLKVAEDPSSGNPYIAALTAPAATIATDCTATSCTAAQMAAYDVWQWQTALKNNLPGGLGSIAVAAIGPLNNTAQITVTVQWSDEPAQATFNETAAPNTYTVVTAL
ncbi:MAG: type IV pilus modification protein PilV [Rhodanobacter sp.]